MGEDPRIAAIRRAFEEARFDERTPEERGFALRFEDTVKPRLIEGITHHLKRSDARRRAYWMMFATIVVVIVVLAQARWTAALMAALVFMAGFIVAMASSPLRPGSDERDVVHTQILETFGCAPDLWLTAREPSDEEPPIAPAGKGMDILRPRFTGRYKDGIRYSAIRVAVKRHEGKGITYDTFRGWHVRFDLPFAFSGTTIIQGHTADARYPRATALEAVRLESEAFNARFIVKTDDQVEARVILSPDVMDHLLNSASVIDQGKGDLMLGFSGSSAHIWVPIAYSAFEEWHPLEPELLIENIHAMFEEFTLLFGFFQDIDTIIESEGFRAQAARNAGSV